MKKVIIVILVLILLLVGVYFLFLKPSCVEYGAHPEITSEECAALGGEIINTLTQNTCCSEKDFLGSVTGVDCQCICCKK